MSAVRVQVLMQPEEARRFEHYCERRGHKKSTLIARLIREHLDEEDQQAGARRPAGARR
jgi:metal-responsive CopG/Arc/MetJ family transcriptional regulator